MSSTQHTTTHSSGDTDNAWREAGDAWGHAANDWAYLFEPYARDTADALFDATGVGPGVELLDLACGGGYATARAARRGAIVSGLDASGQLIDVAKRRTPDGSFGVGTMFNLPYADNSFDVVTSFNGIWGGCSEAVAEAHRVLRPGGQFAITFWGPAKTLGFRDMFITLGGIGAEAKDEMISLASIGTPGIAESMFTEAGFSVDTRGETKAIHEFPDAEMMWQCLRSPGLMVPALRQLGEDGLRTLLMPTLDQHRAQDGSYRISNELTHVIGRKFAS